MSDLKTIGMKHIAFHVDDIEESYTLLKNKGVTMETGISEAGFGGKYFFFKDCNGILIEMYST